MFARESVAQVMEEIAPLLREHWREIAHFQDIALDPDFEQYREAERCGQLRIFTARREQLIGYAIYLLGPAWHYRHSLQAKQDVLFIAKPYRQGRIGWRLIEFADQQLKEEGVQVVYQHVKAAHDFGPLLKRMGYELTDHLYARRLN